ncbi:haloalkane dehalogenase [Mycobacterium xenopi 3993]|nr:haloalkane dehalogenase [Mycobacterium xenopi 3993]
MQTLRTPDERFAGIPEFPYIPRYSEVSDGEGGQLRVAWVQDGPNDADPVLMLHGEPSWSFLYRKMIPIMAAAGYRVVCPDLVGFGRSDKPARREDHSYARHVEWMRALAFDVLDLRRVTLVGQDWGGLIGLRLAAEHPERFSRLVVANTGLPTGDQPMPEIWWRFRETIQASRRWTLAVSCSPVAGAHCATRCAPPTTPVSRRLLLRRPARDAWPGSDLAG